MATLDDVPAVARLLAGRGVAVSRDSLGARIDDDGSGVVLTDATCASFVLDGGVMHVYDFAGDAADVPEIVRTLNVIANGAFAAILSTNLYEDDPLVNALVQSGFVIDWEEPEVRDGNVLRLLGLVREAS